MKESSELLECIGFEALEKLCDQFGGQMIYIPKNCPQTERNREICQIFFESLKGGATCMASYGEAAKVHDLSVRRVQQIIAS
jgi:hypothetical protein